MTEVLIYVQFCLIMVHLLVWYSERGKRKYFKEMSSFYKNEFLLQNEFHL